MQKEGTSPRGNFESELKTFDKVAKSLEIPLLKPIIQIGSKFSKDYHFAHYNNDIIEHPNRQKLSSFHFGNYNSCNFAIKILNYKAKKISLTEIVNP